MIFDYFKIKKIRLAKNISQEELAFRLSTSQTVISHLEAGKYINPSFNLMMKVCNELGVKAEDFIIVVVQKPLL